MDWDRDEGPLERDRDPVRWDFCDRWEMNDIIQERGNERGSVLPLQTVCLNSARMPSANQSPKVVQHPIVRSTTWGRRCTTPLGRVTESGARPYPS
jgi:hypothetical protein